MVSYEAALEALAGRLDEDSVAHSIRVAETASDLALIYGVDVEACRLAGLLHDWDRDQGPDELLATALASGWDVHEVETTRPYLLHARTGATGLREAFPDLSDDVVRAIERHTLGATDMTEIDMVVWVADMIEPSRSFDGVDALREVAGTVSLQDLFAAAYTRSVAHLVEKRKPIHPATVDVWNALVARRRS